ncbi:hypothetical protein [Saliphagus sp. LR7]|uniref:hypothetical protein n=1 Tax=Saliphagus sp. LR7 TaxID=2282654 RepID=UPI000DF7213E|nr:hypothetical protein [Saliphagus sp. LR7]
MKRRALLIAGVGVLGGCLQNSTDTTQSSDGTDQDEEADGTDQENESNGPTEGPDSNTTNQNDTSNGPTQDNATNESAQEADGNGTDRSERDRERRTYDIEADPPSDSPIRYEFEVIQPEIHSSESPLTVTVSISNPTDEMIRYSTKGNAVAENVTYEEFILIPNEEDTYSFDERERLWFESETRDSTGSYESGELDPDETLSRELVLVRRQHEDFPETVPSQLWFATTVVVENGGTGGEDDSEDAYGFSFSLVSTRKQDKNIQYDPVRESRAYEVDPETSSESPIRHEFEVTQPDIHSPESPLMVTVSISNPTDGTIVYRDRRAALGRALTSDDFILVSPDENEYAFNEKERLWFAIGSVGTTDTSLLGELEPDETRSQELVLVRLSHKGFPETVPSEFEFSTSLGVADEGSERITDYQHTVAFSLVAT